MRTPTIKCAVILCSFWAFVPGCVQSEPCRSKTVFASIGCPRGFTSGVFEVSVRHNGAAYEKLSPDLNAICPITTLELEIDEYGAGGGIVVDVSPVDRNGKRWATQQANVTLAPTCTTIAIEDFDLSDEGEEMVPLDGGVSLDSMARDDGPSASPAQDALKPSDTEDASKPSDARDASKPPEDPDANKPPDDPDARIAARGAARWGRALWRAHR